MSEPRPWVLLRYNSPQHRFATLDAGKRFYNSMIFGWHGWKQPEGALLGPGGEAWYRAGRRGEWHRDDDRRHRERPQQQEDAA